MLFSGIDLHKDNLMIVAMDDQGVVQRLVKLPTTEEQIKQYFQPMGYPHRAVVIYDAIRRTPKTLGSTTLAPRYGQANKTAPSTNRKKCFFLRDIFF